MDKTATTYLIDGAPKGTQYTFISEQNMPDVLVHSPTCLT